VVMSFVNRIWCRFKRSTPRPSTTDAPEIDSPAPRQEQLALEYDLQLALQVDASIRQTREIFDFALIEPRPHLSSAATPKAEFSPRQETVAIKITTPPEIDMLASPKYPIDEGDRVFFAFIECLRDEKPKPTSMPELSRFVSFALPFDPAIVPQLASHSTSASGHISLKERAAERASQLGEAFGLTSADELTLAKILRRYRLHHKTITELEALLHQGFSTDELLTAHKIRKIWRRSAYPRTEIMKYYQDRLRLNSIAYSSYTSHIDFLGEFQQPSPDTVFMTSRSIPTWRKAARWARTLGNISSSELDSILSWHHERWLNSPNLWVSAPSFVEHVDQCIRTIARDLHDVMSWEMAFEASEPYEYPEKEMDRGNRRELFGLGLIPDIWVDPFDERVSIDPEFPLLDDYWPKKGVVEDDE
jgi:hypothetical protein